MSLVDGPGRIVWHDGRQNELLWNHSSCVNRCDLSPECAVANLEQYYQDNGNVTAMFEATHFPCDLAALVHELDADFSTIESLSTFFAQYLRFLYIAPELVHTIDGQYFMHHYGLTIPAPGFAGHILVAQRIRIGAGHEVVVTAPEDVLPTIVHESVHAMVNDLIDSGRIATIWKQDERWSNFASLQVYRAIETIRPGYSPSDWGQDHALSQFRASNTRAGQPRDSTDIGCPEEQLIADSLPEIVRDNL